MTQSKKDRTRYWSEHYLLGQPIVVHLLTLAICIATRAIDIRVVQGLVRDDKTNIMVRSQVFCETGRHFLVRWSDVDSLRRG